MKQLYEIVEYDGGGMGMVVSTLGTIYALNEDDARQQAALYFNNDDIRKTGFYGARLPKASIKMEEKTNHWREEVRKAEYIIRKYGKG